MTPKGVSETHKRQADKINGLVVQHLEDDEITIVERYELQYPSRAQKVLYVSPEKEEAEEI